MKIKINNYILGHNLALQNRPFINETNMFTFVLDCDNLGQIAVPQILNKTVYINYIFNCNIVDYIS